MTTTDPSLSAIVTEKVLAHLADFWEHPEPDRFTGRMPARIAGGAYDQQVPEGTRNPYWEIVRQLPLSTFGYGARRPEPDPHWFGRDGTLREFGGRHSLCGAFAWSIISPGDVGVDQGPAGRCGHRGARRGRWLLGVATRTGGR